MNDLVSYAYDLVSYLILQPSIRKYPINRIILFGSVARNDYTKKSDIDIFIDISNLEKISLLSREIEKIKTNFFESERMKKWSRLNVANNFNIVIGKLKEKKWDDLRRSMQSHAILIWAKFFDIAKKDLKSYALIKWKTGVKNINKRINTARKLYGYKQKGKIYKGLLEETNAQSISKGVALVPTEHINRFRELFNNLKVRYNIVDIFIK